MSYCLDTSFLVSVLFPDSHTSRAFAWLEKAYKLRDPQLTYLKVGPKFAPIRSDPRYHDLLRRMGLPS